MFPYYMTAASGQGGGFPPCGICDSRAGMWSEQFTPTEAATGCACKKGHFFVEGNDQSSFTCPKCPPGSTKDGISRVETCRPLREGEVVEYDAEEAMFEANAKAAMDANAASTADISNMNPNDEMMGYGVDSSVSHRPIEVKTLVSPTLPTWVLALTICNSVCAFLFAMLLAVYVKKHVQHTRVYVDAQPSAVYGDIVQTGKDTAPV